MIMRHQMKLLSEIVVLVHKNLPYKVIERIPLADCVQGLKETLLHSEPDWLYVPCGRLQHGVAGNE